MRSLRWRIASWYALLLIGVLLALSLTITVQFRAILQQQAQARVQQTVDQIKRATLPPPNVFGVYDTSGGASLRQLDSSANLEQWASPTTWIQVDSAEGYPLAHSAYMGTNRFPQANDLTQADPEAVHEVQMPTGPFLVEDRLLVAGPLALVVHVGEPMDQLNRALAQTRDTILFILGITVIAVIVISIVLAGQATNPINELSRAMREIGSDRLHRRIKWKHRQDEIGQLAENFDDLLARLEEAFARERQFISDASHELRTPLTSINANAQMLLRWGDKEEQIRRESLETIAQESGALARMVSGMLTLAKADSGEAIPKEPVPLANLASEAVQNTISRAQEKHLRLEFDVEDASAVVLGDPNLLRQLISNLIDNAIKFTEKGGVFVRTRSTERDAIVEVEDTGPGIESDELPFIFDRFYRTDKSRNRDVPGTGLGLAIVRSIARVHDGRVEAERAPSGGALFRVYLPRVDREQL